MIPILATLLVLALDLVSAAGLVAGEGALGGLGREHPEGEWAGCHGTRGNQSSVGTSLERCN